MNSLLHCERSSSLQETKKIFYNWIKKENLSVSFTFKNSLGRVSSAILSDHDHNMLSNGSGKGLNHELGAVAEAIEHFIAARESDSDLNVLNSHFVAQQIPLDSCDIILQMLSCPDVMIPTCYMYEFGDHPKSKVSMPLALVNPWFAERNKSSSKCYSLLCRYSTNSGTAIGITFEDAFLHALNEEIERFYLSHLFMYALGIDSCVSFYEVSMSNVEFHGQEIMDSLKRHYRFRFIFSESFFGVCFFAVIGIPIERNSDLDISIPCLSHVGSGASLSRSVALERAVDEFLQIHYDWQPHHQNLYKDIADQCVKSELLPLVYLSDFSLPQVKLIEIMKKTKDVNMTSRQMIYKIVECLNENSYRVFYRIKSRVYDPFFVVSLYIPGFERFHLIREGRFVLPQLWLKKNKKQ